MSATEIKPYPTLEQMRAVVRELSEAVDVLEDAVWAIKEQAEAYDNNPGGIEGPTHELMGQVQEFVVKAGVQLSRARGEHKRLRKLSCDLVYLKLHADYLADQGDADA